MRVLALTALLLAAAATAAIVAGEAHVPLVTGEPRSAPTPAATSRPPPLAAALPTVAPTPAPPRPHRVAEVARARAALPRAPRCGASASRRAARTSSAGIRSGRRSPNRPWRRHGTDRLVRMVLRVASGYASAHPRAARLVVGDLSRPRGGDFGVRYGGIGHSTHQNGLDADVYLPRRDGRERAPRRVAQVARRRSQELVDRFVKAGASVVLVGPRTGLEGPAGVVKPWPNHDDHLHVRLPAD